MNYRTIKQYADEEVIIKKSRFIANCFPVQNEEQAINHIKEISKEHYKATHNTFAYVIGRNKDIKRFSDDGEPSGTAGKPILDCILNNNLTNVLVIVTRYFGGIKLGAGGLVRAYSSAASMGIEKSMPITMQYSALIEIRCDYYLSGKLEAYINNKNIIKLKETGYEEKVKFHIYVPEENKEEIRDELIDMTGDNVEITPLKEEYIISDR